MQWHASNICYSILSQKWLSKTKSVHHTVHTQETTKPMSNEDRTIPSDISKHQPFQGSSPALCSPCESFSLQPPSQVCASLHFFVILKWFPILNYKLWFNIFVPWSSDHVRKYSWPPKCLVSYADFVKLALQSKTKGSLNCLISSSQRLYGKIFRNPCFRYFE